MEESGYGLPPLRNLQRNLQRILDAKAITRAQLARRSGLSAPTVRRATEADKGVRASTARKVAKALAVPQETLYSSLSEEELKRAARLPAVTAGRSYSYLDAPPRNGRDGGEPEATPEVSQRSTLDGSAEQEEPLREALVRVEARLGAIEEVVLELASRPVAEFDVRLIERKGERP